MQKKIIALAVAGLMSGAAFAQSNVQIYGVADVYYGNFSATGGQKVNAINAGGLSGSRLGFRGTEDLGNGMKAVFTLEYGTLALDSGDANNNRLDNTRQSFVGLTGNFGTVVAGRLQSPGMSAGAKYDAHVGSVLSPLGQLTDANDMSISSRDALTRFNNAIAYVSPKFSGFTGTAAYSFVGEQNRAPRSTGWTLSGDYDNGPLAINFTHVNLSLGTAEVSAANGRYAAWTAGAAADYTVVNAASAAAALVAAGGSTDTTEQLRAPVAFSAASTTKQKENFLAASYNFGMAKVVASWQTRKNTTNGVVGNDSRVWNLGGVIPVGAGNIHLSYAALNDKTVGDDDAKSWGVAYTHGLSKRTTAYAGYTRVKFKDGTVAIGGVTPTAAGKTSALGVGLRHSF